MSEMFETRRRKGKKEEKEERQRKKRGNEGEGKLRSRGKRGHLNGSFHSLLTVGRMITMCFQIPRKLPPTTVGSCSHGDP